MAEMPKCRKCGDEDWTLECVVTSLVYAFSQDPEGPFKRDDLVDRTRSLSFFCDGCGSNPDRASRAALEAMYRGWDPERAFHPTQGGLLRTIGSDDLVLVPPPVLSAEVPTDVGQGR